MANLYLFLGRFGFILATVAFGVFAYAARRMSRLDYGIVESLLGIIIVATYVPNEEGSQLTVILQMAGGVFVLIRGIDNAVEGFTAMVNKGNPA